MSITYSRYEYVIEAVPLLCSLMLRNVKVFSKFVRVGAIFLDDSDVSGNFFVVGIGDVTTLSSVVIFLNFFCKILSSGKLSLVRYIRKTVDCGW